MPGVRVHRADLAGDDVVVVGGTRCTTPLRTVLDLARLLDFAPAVAAMDSALRRGLVGAGELAGAVAALPRAPGSRAVRAAAGATDPRAGSVLESLARVLLCGSGLPAPLTQYEIRDRTGCFVARVDFCWPAARLIVEVDGFAYHSDRDAYRRDRDRLNALGHLGWQVLRFTWEDVVHRPEHVVGLVRSMLER